jgi:hypothetical protein
MRYALNGVSHVTSVPKILKNGRENELYLYIENVNIW